MMHHLFHQVDEIKKYWMGCLWGWSFYL